LSNGITAEQNNKVRGSFTIARRGEKERGVTKNDHQVKKREGQGGEQEGRCPESLFGTRLADTRKS